MIRQILVSIGVLMVFTGQSLSEPKSGYDFLKAETKEMQDDDFLNPGIQAVDEGRELFNKPGANGKSCASCHGEDGAKLDPKRIAMYPVFDKTLGKAVTLQQRIHMESEGKLGNKPMKYDGKDALKLEVFVRHLARGETVNVQTDGDMAPVIAKGKKIYETRAGQLDMSCAGCHVYYPGQKIRANVLSQGQGNGFPNYRLKNGKINGIHSRFNGCYKQFRAAKKKPGNDDYVALEAYVMSRGNGLKIETPAVRF